MSAGPIDADQLLAALDGFPKRALAHVPTPIEAAERLCRHMGAVRLFVKRDDCTGLGFGGNKVRQLEYYFGQAIREEADTVLITGAVQSNFVRATAAAARHCDMECHVQLEERVPNIDALHRTSGNVLLCKILGATLHSYPTGEDEAGADANLQSIAGELRQNGARPYVIPLGANHKPLGALAYVEAAIELLKQCQEQSIHFDHIVVTSGSGATHAGLLFGLRALGNSTHVHGVCPRRDAKSQAVRIRSHMEKLAAMLNVAPRIAPQDVDVTDITLAPGYGRLNKATIEALQLTAQCEGLLLDPVYTAKAMAALIHYAQADEMSGNVLFWHTGGQPALFAYGIAVLDLD